MRGFHGGKGRSQVGFVAFEEALARVENLRC